MLVNALITGVKHWEGPANGEKKAYDFHTLNFIDTENPEGSPQSCSLPKDGESLSKLIPVLTKAKMTVVKMHVFQNGKFSNFGGFSSP